MADTSRCLPTKNFSESAALLSLLALETEENLCCHVYLHMFVVVFFSYKDMSSPKRDLAVTGEVPLVFVP